jgi:hypothetical protein
MHFTISQVSCFGMGHWLKLSLFVFIILCSELKGDSIDERTSLSNQGVFSKDDFKVPSHPPNARRQKFTDDHLRDPNTLPNEDEDRELTLQPFLCLSLF